LRTDTFDYYLPAELVAQRPAEPRDASRLMVLRADGGLEHRRFRDLPEYLEPGDLLVLNQTRVMPARLLGRKAATGGRVEVLLLRPLPGAGGSPVGSGPGAAGDFDRAWEWEALVRPGRRVQPGAELVFDGPDGRPLLFGKVGARTDSGGRAVTFRPAPAEQAASGWTGAAGPEGREAAESFGRLIDVLGRVPLPPYIKRPPADPERYQTIYASVRGSAAAPTAGLHFTPAVFSRLEARGVKTARVTLHIGLDTFRPVREENLEDHRMHSEWFDIPAETAQAVADCRRRGAAVTACGTTVVRTLEAGADPERPGLVRPGSGETRLFIYPGYRFQVVDRLLTNFHLPRSTLLMLVAAFAGTDRIMSAYREAVRLRYRFYSFGDAMLIFRGDGP